MVIVESSKTSRKRPGGRSGDVALKPYAPTGMKKKGEGER